MPRERKCEHDAVNHINNIHTWAIAEILRISKDDNVVIKNHIVNYDNILGLIGEIFHVET
jgi:hypothetical protein